MPITGTGGVPTTSVTATSTSDSTTEENLTQSQSTVSGTGTLIQNSEAELVMASNAVGGTIPATIAASGPTATGENFTHSKESLVQAVKIGSDTPVKV